MVEAIEFRASELPFQIVIGMICSIGIGIDALATAW
jgi:hypothetical protein